MDLYNELLIAVNENDGYKIRHILEAAKATGVLREDALSVLEKLFDKASRENDDDAQTQIVDFMDILKFCCQPQYLIWPNPNSSPGANPP